MFNEDCKITKFKCVTDIIDRWFNIRKNIYIKRRDYLLEHLKKELDIIKFKVKFIMEIISETLEIRNVKKKTIIDKLVEKNYPKFAIKEGPASYDYLLGMDLYKLTSDEIEELKKREELKQTEYTTLYNKSSNDLWKEDIAEFVAQYKKHISEYDKEHSRVEIIQKQTKKPRLKKK